MKKPKRLSDDLLAFRVWDPENECYQQDDADDCHINQNGSLTCVFWGDCDTMSTEYVDQAKCVIERSTGLRDKNGKLIFDGDILRFFWFDKYVEYPVKWDKYGARFLFMGYNEELNLNFSSDKSEIIGNIHQPRRAKG